MKYKCAYDQYIIYFKKNILSLGKQKLLVSLHVISKQTSAKLIISFYDTFFKLTKDIYKIKVFVSF